MSAGSFDLLLFRHGGPLRELWHSSLFFSPLPQPAGFRSSPSTSTSFYCSAPPCMKQSPRGEEPVSMRLQNRRCGLVMKYSRFMHIRRCLFHYLFLRGART